MIKVKKLVEEAKIPVKGSAGAAGFDLFSLENYLLEPGERKLIKTGIAVVLNEGTYGRIAPRSGLAFKDGIDVLAGVIDSDYRGEIGVILINLGQKSFGILKEMRIAQLIIEKYDAGAYFVEEEELEETKRGAGGFGSTGTN